MTHPVDLVQFSNHGPCLDCVHALELLSLSDPAGNPVGTVNADRTLHQGLELGLRWQPHEAVTVSANGLWNHFRFDGDAVYGDHALAGVPRAQPRGTALAAARGLLPRAERRLGAR